MSAFEFYHDWLNSYEAMRYILCLRSWNWKIRNRQWDSDAAYLVGCVESFYRSAKVKEVDNFLVFFLVIELLLKPVDDLHAFHVHFYHCDH